MHIKNDIAAAMLIIVVFFIIGCESDAKVQARYDGWYPPGATREQIVAKFGNPWTTVQRPADNPTQEQWRDAIRPKINCLKPNWIAYMVMMAESRTGQRVQSLETYSPADHITFAEKLDFLFGAHVEAVYYNSEYRVITSELIPEHIFTD